jgi:hypothetical protein
VLAGAGAYATQRRLEIAAKDVRSNFNRSICFWKWQIIADFVAKVPLLATPNSDSVS